MRTRIVHLFGAALIVAVAAMALAGCYISLDEGAGAVGIRLPDPRQVLGDLFADTARIYVINGAALLTVGEGTAYAEFALEPPDAPGERYTEYSVGPVPAGPGYRVVLVFGSYQSASALGSGGQAFVPSYYAVSDEFTVVAGRTTATNELGPRLTGFIPIDPANTLGRNLVGVVAIGEDTEIGLDAAVYTATATKLYKAQTSPEEYEEASFVEVGAVTGRTINGLSLGTQRRLSSPLVEPSVWVNTTNGILVGDDLDGSIMVGSQLTGVSMLGSGAFPTANTLVDLSVVHSYGYVQFSGGLSAVRLRQIGDNDPEWDWIDPVDLSEIITGRPILDLDVEDAFGGSLPRINGFFASKLGAFRLMQGIFEEAPQSTAAFLASPSAQFFNVAIDGQAANVTNVAVVNNAAREPQHLYVGTPRGALRVSLVDLEAALDTEGMGAVAGLFIDESRGQAVRMIEAAGELVVIVTSHFLLYSTNAGDEAPTFHEIPLYASSAGEVTGMLLVPVPGSPIALISGTEGLAGITLGDQ